MGLLGHISNDDDFNTEDFNIFVCIDPSLDWHGCDYTEGYIKTDADIKTIKELKDEHNIHSIETLIIKLQNEGFIAEIIKLEVIKWY
jgi:hypothetical protein